jgi:Na+:H+ antiporter, NhaA family
MESGFGEQPLFPQAPIDRVLDPLRHFLHIEAMGGIALLVATAAALALANSPVSGAYLAFWQIPIGIQVGTHEFEQSLHHLIDDGLMVIFFFVVGLEVKRELVLGELRGLRRAALPLVCAVGGMVVPAGVYLLLQGGKPAARGWGIPMATDIAFVIGCLAVLGPRVPRGLRVLLLSLAIADDIGAILVIAFGYAHGLKPLWLALGISGFVVVFALSRLGVRRFGVYVVCSVAIWFAFHQSGVHTTIAGVILGLLTPARSQIDEGLAARILKRCKAMMQKFDWRTESHRAGQVRRHQRLSQELVSPLEYLIDALHPWVSFVIMPLFALANAGVSIRFGHLGSPVALAIVLGLFLGKPLGIGVAAFCAVKSGLSPLPDGVTWRHLIGGGILAGIGFTMALFIAALALDGELLDRAKVGVMLASLISAVFGVIVLLLAPYPSAVRVDAAAINEAAKT